MKNKVLLCIMGLLLVSLGIMMSITNGKRAQIQQVRKKVSQVNEQAKNDLLAFAKNYYTFNSQSDYDKRFSKVSSILALSKDQQNNLFDNGLDSTGGSRIDNLPISNSHRLH